MRELLMTASKKIALPVMTLPVREGAPPGAAAAVASYMNKVKIQSEFS